MARNERLHGSLGGLGWASVIATVESWPANAVEWDLLEAALHEIGELGRNKLAARTAARRDLNERLDQLRSVLGDDREYFDIPDIDGWSADTVDAELAADLAAIAFECISYITERNDTACVTASNARHGLELRTRLNELETAIVGALGRLATQLGSESETVDANEASCAEGTDTEELSGAATTIEQDSEPEELNGKPVDQGQDGHLEPPAPIPSPVTPLAIGSSRVAVAHSESPEPESPAGTVNRPVLADFVPLSKFFETRIINSRGEVLLAPWNDASADFLSELEEASRRAFRCGSFAELSVFVAAAAALDGVPYVDPRDLDAALELLASPDSGSSGVDGTRTARILNWLESNRVEGKRISFALVLEAVRPSLDRPLSDSEIDVLLAASDFGDVDLAEATRRLLRLGRTGAGAMDAIRVELGHDTAVLMATDPLSDLDAARRTFHEELVSLWSGAGAKGLVRHCREAWAMFVEEHVAPLHEQLKPSGDAADFLRWPLARLRSEARALVAEHRVIADRWDAGFKNRKSMDRAAARIADLVAGVVEAAERARSSGDAVREGAPALDAIRRVTQSAQLDGNEDGVYRELVALALGAGATACTLRTHFGEDDLARRPGLVGLLVGSGGEAVAWEEGVPPSAFPIPLRAAATLLDEALPLGDVEPGNWARASFGALGERAQFDLAALLVSASSIDQREKTSIHRKQDEYLEQTRKQFQLLIDTVRRLDRMASPLASGLGKLVEEARSVVEDETRAHLHSRLLRAWVDEVLAAADTTLRFTLDDYRLHSKHLPDDRAAALRAAIDESRYEDAVAQLFPESANGGVDRQRETLWRDEAARTYTKPLEALRGDPETLGLGASLANQWQQNPREHNALQALRRAFFDFVSGDANDPRRRRRRSPGTPGQLRQIENNVIRIHATELREVLTADGPNPTFVPQVRDTSDIVIASLYASPVKPKELAREASRRAKEARSGAHDIVILLAPRLPVDARTEILRHFRDSEVRAAVIDDLDICRLVAPGADAPRGFLGLVELALEQLRWSAQFSPFRIQDGRNTSLDMFVGRAASADALANQNRYTRLFSGRKLGKSALLKYIELQFDREPLPSGNILRVISVVAAGGEDEDWLVDEIAEALTHSTGFSPDPVSGKPGDRLTAMLGQYLANHARESLLVVIDEADQFVEQQLDEYELNSESCLSFRMMKALPKADDAQGLPRVRFVFAGYRVTSTNRGAWANAGDVLRIEPLTEAEAVQLIAGPLSRLGIDADGQAPHIARRCGYQPAVLLKFGSELLDHLRQRHRVTGDRLVVTSDDVTRTYDSEAVQHEIRTVVQNNFQMNEIGAAVFGALLLVLSDMPAAAALSYPGDQIVERLREVGGDLGWLMSENQSAEREVERNLRDFVARGLIVEVDLKDGLRGYRLRFPHQLATLVSDDLRRTIRSTIGQVKSSGAVPRRAAGLLPRRVLDDITDMRSSTGRELGCRAVVVGGHWVEALEDDRAGIAARLGLRSADVARPGDDRDLPVVLGVSEKFARSFLERQRDDIGLLVGGIDLLRWSVASKETMSYGLTRLDARRISWWFETRRALQFETPNAVAEIERATGGVPMLVGLFNALVETDDGSAVDAAAFGRAMVRYGASLGDVTERLTKGGNAERLSRREGEILVMAAAVAEIGLVIDTRKDLGQAGVVSELGLGEIQPFSGTLESEDRRAATVLRLTGLLPVDSDLVIRFNSDADPGITIGRAIRQLDGLP